MGGSGFSSTSANIMNAVSAEVKGLEGSMTRNIQASTRQSMPKSKRTDRTSSGVENRGDVKSGINEAFWEPH